MTSTQTPREQYATAAHAPLIDAPPPAVWRHRHLLDLDAVSPEEIATVLRSAQAMKAMLRRDVKKAPTLRGRTIVTLFSEPSTRTRVSFETAGKLLSADVINLSSGGSSTEKGESLVDTVLTLQAAAADVLVMRHSHSGPRTWLPKHWSARPSSTPGMARTPIPRRRCSTSSPSRSAWEALKASAWQSSETSPTAVSRAQTCGGSARWAPLPCCAGHPRSCRGTCSNAEPTKAIPSPPWRWRPTSTGPCGEPTSSCLCAFKRSVRRRASCQAYASTYDSGRWTRTGSRATAHRQSSCTPAP